MGDAEAVIGRFTTDHEEHRGPYKGEIMTKREGFELALKIMGVWCLVQALVSVGTLVTLLWQAASGGHTSLGEVARQFGPFGMASVVYAGIGLLLLGQARRLSRGLLGAGEMAAEAVRCAATPGPEWFGFAVRVIGVVVLLKGIAYGLSEVGMEISGLAAARGRWPIILNALAQGAAGIYLMTGAKTLVAWAWKARSEAQAE